MLSAHSWNALLKTLEEPPPHVVFVFATTEVHKIPATILSRCQRFDFKLISTARLTTHLTEILRAEKIEAAPEAVRLVARQAAGSVRDGLSLLDQTIAYVGTERLTAEVTADVLGIADRQLLVALTVAVLDRDPGAALRLIARAADRGVDLGQLGRSFLGFLRDLEVVASVKPAPGVELADLLDATPEEIDEVRALAERAGPGLVTVLFNCWARAVDEASRLPTPRLLYEMAAIDLCAAEPMVPLGDLLQRLDDLEGRLRGARPAPPRPRAAAVRRRLRARLPRQSRRLRDRAGGARPGRPRSARRSAPSPRGGGRRVGLRRRAGPRSLPASLLRRPSPPAEKKPVGSPAEVWRSILTNFEAKRPRLAGLLAHAEVASMTTGAVTLAFPDKFTSDQTEKLRGEVEASISEALGQPTRVTFSVGGPQRSGRTARPSARRSASRATRPPPIARPVRTRPASTRAFAAHRTCSARR